jgi:hypothetical protein
MDAPATANDVAEKNLAILSMVTNICSGMSDVTEGKMVDSYNDTST